MGAALRAVIAAVAATLATSTVGIGATAADVSDAERVAAVAAGRASTSQLLAVPRVSGRLGAADIGLVVNTNDPYSVEVGRYYQARRHLSPSQVLQVALPMRAALSEDEFNALAARIDAHFGAGTQALALAWVRPYAVDCNSLTGALALGYDRELCKRTCALSRLSRYFNARTSRPWTDLHLRPAMQLAAPDLNAARAMIDRGVASDATLGLRGAPPANAIYVTTGDAARNVRAPIFPPPVMMRGVGVDVQVLPQAKVADPTRVLIFETGAVRVDDIARFGWLPGALADHLTSFGGQLDADSGQMSAMAWLAAGATASYGTVSEPCAHPQKFPHPQALLLHYVQGETAIEAYWKSVASPQQGAFIGEPLAAPFWRRPAP